MDNPNHPDPKQELPDPNEKLLRAPTFWEAHGKLVTGVIIGVLLCVAGFSAWVIYSQAAKPVPETTMMPAVPTQIASPSPTTSALIPTMFNGIAPDEDASATSELSTTPTGLACSQEVKVCADGSYVGRTGPNCEFTACP